MRIDVSAHANAVAELVGAAVRRRPGVTEMRVALEDLRPGMETASAVRSLLDMPAFDNSQMDGYAIRSSDIAGASLARPVRLAVAGTIAAGDRASTLSEGTAAPIMTGAPIPSGADAVVPIEKVNPPHFQTQSKPVAASQQWVRFTAPTVPGTFVRAQSSDLSRGDIVVETGVRLTPAAIGTLAAAGITEVEVVTPVRVAVVSTGTEIASGQVPDANGYTLSHSLSELGLSVSRAVVADDSAACRQELSELAKTHDLIITTGGVSAGAFEVVREVLEPHSNAWFGHVAMQPGGPQGLADVELDGVRLAVICLPGNPVSVLVSFELFVRPALAQATRNHFAERPRGTARLSAPTSSPPGLLQVRRGRFDGDGLIELEGGPGSHLLAAYARSSLLVFIPSDAEHLESGTTVEWWKIS